MSNPNHVYVPETNIWDLDEIRELDPKSAEFKELLVRLYQNSNLHAMAINRNSGGDGDSTFPYGWTLVTERCGNTVAVGHGYIANGATYPVEFHTPATIAAGDEFAIAGRGTAGWHLYLQTGQTLYLTDTSQYVEGDVSYLGNLAGRPLAGVQVLCIEANTTFVARLLTDAEINTILGPFTAVYVTDVSAVTTHYFRCCVYDPISDWWVAGSGRDHIWFNQSNPTLAWSSINFGGSVYMFNDIDTDGAGTWVLAENAGWTTYNTTGDPVTKANWHQFGAPSTIKHGVAYGNGLWVGVGDNGAIETSPDGVSWTVRTSPTVATMYCIRYGNGLWVMAGSNGEIYTSADPTAGAASWILRASQVTPFTIRDVAFGVSCSWQNGLFVAVGDSGSITSSPDGITWTQDSTGSTLSLKGVRLLDNEWVAVYAYGGNMTFLHTTDPTGVWTYATTVIPSAMICAANRIATNNLDTIAFGSDETGGDYRSAVATK